MPAVIGLILFFGVSMGISDIKNYRQILIAVISFALAISGKLDYAFIIIGGGIAGYFLF